MSPRPRPNFFFVGAMKSGSTSLANHLRAHPSIFMASRPKEPHFFVKCEELEAVYPRIAQMGFCENEERYLSLFAGAEGCSIVGEASQNYTRMPRVTGVAGRIASFCPEARILYVMRDPIERTISHYWYMVTFYGEGRPMLRAVQEDPDYRDTSHYAMQLEPYFEHFDREQVLCLTLEEMRADGLKTVQRIYRWLGVDPEFEPPTLERRANVTPETLSLPRGAGLLHRVRHSKLWTAVGPWVPSGLRRVGKTMAAKPVSRQDVPTDDVADYLRPIQEAQTRELETLLGRSFDGWTTLRPHAAAAGRSKPA